MVVLYLIDCNLHGTLIFGWRLVYIFNRILGTKTLKSVTNISNISSTTSVINIGRLEQTVAIKTVLSSVSIILKREGFFGSENAECSNDINSTNITNTTNVPEVDSSSTDKQIGLIMTLSMSLLGILLLIYGFIRDYVSFGVCRLVMYISLCLTYLLFAIAEPGHSDFIQDSFPKI